MGRMMRGIPQAADHLVVVLSDIEMGAGGVLDDCPRSDFLAEIVLSYCAEAFDGVAIDMVFNGDTFDLLKTSVEGVYPRRITAKVAEAKMERIIAAHPCFFEAVRRFLAYPGLRGVHFVVGNHDLELLFPSVQRRVAREVGALGVNFPGFRMRIGDVEIEHGMQGDPLFAVDPDRLFVTHESEVVLVQPWGATAIIDVALPLQSVLYDLDRLKPRDRVLDLLPEVRELLVNTFWRYWTRDWWVGYWTDDPTRRITWTMLKEVVDRFRSLSADVTVAQTEYRERVCQGDGPRVLVLGHLHQAAWWSRGDRKVLTTGCIRDEFMVDEQGAVVGHLPKTYAEVYLRAGRAVRSELVEVRGPPVPEGHVLAHVRDILPRINPLLEGVALAPDEQERRRVEETKDETLERDR